MQVILGPPSQNISLYNFRMLLNLKAGEFKLSPEKAEQSSYCACSLRLTTFREFTMMRFMNQLTEKPDWDAKVEYLDCQELVILTECRFLTKK
jgi:hypothetical protein